MTPSRMDRTGEAGPEPDGRAMTPDRRRPWAGSMVVVVPALSIVLVLAIAVATAYGAVTVELSTVVRVIGHQLFGSVVTPDFSPIDEQIIWRLRLPEVLLAAVVGAGLSVVGATLQAVVRNPLADPYLLGVSSGAGFMAAMVITLGSTAVAGLSASGAAFVGALLSTVLVLVIAAGPGGRFAPVRVVLAGVTLSFFFLGLTNYLIFQSSDPNAATAVLFWLLGSLAGASWSTLWLPAAVVALGTLYLLSRGRALNAVVVGEETALSVGIDVRAFRLRMLVVTSLITGVMVAAAGGIAFVGLVVPHVVRLLVGPDHRRGLPVSALAGAIFLVVVDLICRVAVSPNVLPLGIVTSLVGAPFFLWLLRRARTGAMAG
jgi:iron complex transport system permease protein